MLLFARPLLVLALAMPHCLTLPTAQGGSVQTPRKIRLDVFIRSDQASAKAVNEYVDGLKQKVTGLDIQVHDVLQDRGQLAILYEISKKAGREKPVLPAFHSCDRTYFGFSNADKSGPEVERLFTADVYTRPTCPRCQKLKAFLQQVKTQWPAVRFRIYEVDTDSSARGRWQALCNAAGVTPGLPTIDFARRVIIGYQGDDITGMQLNALIEQVSRSEKPQPSDKDHSHRHSPDNSDVTFVSFFPIEQIVEKSLETGSETIESLELPEEAIESEMGESTGQVEVLGDSNDPETINVPLLGRISVRDLGMPAFTLAVGLVDGFNPCAMWVLVFLLSVLVNIKDRKKIIIIAGTFVVVSGAAYFAFMAAWLNLFLLVGIIRPVQMVLGGLALSIGAINIKDFFAFKKGISLSIPEEQKPGLYRRVREIVSAQYLTVALSGAVALAVIVNMIELLCTAGLPALYTQILTMQSFPIWKNYSYLGLYIAAYMFDDMVLVGIVVTTLSHRKLQEREGRWLKLLSGVVILLLGLVMLFKPNWLQLESLG